MEFALLGFLTGLSLILVIGAQNIFVIEQGLKKQHIFLVCLVCSISDLFLIFLGISLFYFFQLSYFYQLNQSHHPHMSNLTQQFLNLTFQFPFIR